MNSDCTDNINSFLSKMQDSIAKIELNKIVEVLNKLNSIDNLNGNKLLIMGNGGSALNGEHLLLELSKELVNTNSNLPKNILSLNNNVGIITAWANDFKYEEIFSNQIKLLGNKGDVLIGITTSGKSKNILNGFSKAKELGLINICFSGNNVESIIDKCDVIVKTPSDKREIIESIHLILFHLIKILYKNLIRKDE
jgi:D-sedoheptulose 7-phosphate isomerase